MWKLLRRICRIHFVTASYDKDLYNFNFIAVSLPKIPNSKHIPPLALLLHTIFWAWTGLCWRSCNLWRWTILRMSITHWSWSDPIFVHSSFQFWSSYPLGSWILLPLRWWKMRLGSWLLWHGILFDFDFPRTIFYTPVWKSMMFANLFRFLFSVYINIIFVFSPVFISVVAVVVVAVVVLVLVAVVLLLVSSSSSSLLSL